MVIRIVVVLVTTVFFIPKPFAKTETVIAVGVKLIMREEVESKIKDRKGVLRRHLARK